MKNFFLAAALALGATAAHAQSETFKAFKFDIAFGYAIPGGEGSKGGVIFALEPKYALNDKITLGLRYEGAVMARAIVDDEGIASEVEAKASGSYLATADYYFNTNSFRPFVGLGAGIFANASSSDFDTADINDAGEIEVEAKSKFGVTPRVGFETGHFRTAIEYNIVGKANEVNYNYLGIKIGFFLGGGRK